MDRRRWVISIMAAVVLFLAIVLASALINRDNRSETVLEDVGIPTITVTASVSADVQVVATETMLPLRMIEVTPAPVEQVQPVIVATTNGHVYCPTPMAYQGLPAKDCVFVTVP